MIRSPACSRCDHMSEEVPFKSIKITLSEEALRMLGNLRKRGSFRSNSMTIEECIRALHELSDDLGGIFQKSIDEDKPIPNEERRSAFKRYALRLARFVVVKRPQKGK